MNALHAPVAPELADAPDAVDPLDLEVAPRSERSLVAACGASVTIAERGGRERIEVRDAQQRLVFELDPVSGRTVLSVPAGDLSIAAAGDVDIRAGGTVRCRGAEVALEAGAGHTASRLSLRAGLAELVASRVETVADRLFEKARSAFRQVEDLHQLRAGRSRTVVAAGFHVKSGHTSIESDDEVRIDGKAIHLG
jgi:hypothetical protein